MNGQTDNQQCKTTDLEVAWLCGLIDGEGSIGLKVQKYLRGSDVFYVAPYIQIVNTHQPTLEIVDRILTGLQVGHYIDWPRPHVYPPGKRPETEYKPLWRVLINGLKRCDLFLDLVLPYLVIKKDDAALVKEFIGSRKENYYKHLPYSTREIEIIKSFRRVRRSGKAGKASLVESLNDYMQGVSSKDIKV